MSENVRWLQCFGGKTMILSRNKWLKFRYWRRVSEDTMKSSLVPKPAIISIMSEHPIKWLGCVLLYNLSCRGGIIFAEFLFALVD